MNSPELVFQVLEAMHHHDCPCILFGGWAEEALGLRYPAPHGDIDLLLTAADFSKLDILLASRSSHWREIERKRFHHKRAFLIQGVAVEIMLVRPEGAEFVTWFWGDVRFDWHRPLACNQEFSGRNIEVATVANLSRYRANRPRVQPDRWKKNASLVALKPG